MKLETLETRALLAGADEVLGGESPAANDVQGEATWQDVASEWGTYAQETASEWGSYAKEVGSEWGAYAMELGGQAFHGAKEGFAWTAAEVVAPAVVGAVSAVVGVPVAGFLGGTKLTAEVGGELGHNFGEYVGDKFCATELSQYVYESAEDCNASITHLGEVGGAGFGGVLGLGATTLSLAYYSGGVMPLLKTEAVIGAIAGVAYEQYSVYGNGSESLYAQCHNSIVSA